MTVENNAEVETDVSDATDGATVSEGGEATEGQESNEPTAPTNTAEAVAAALKGDESDEDESGEEESAEGEEGEQEEVDEEDEEEDPEDIKAPEGLSDGAKKRFESLVDRVKTVSAERDEQRAKNDQIVKVMEDTGSSPEEFAQVLLMLGHANSGDPERISQALGMLDTMRGNLARMTGKTVPGVDVLSDFPDLRQKVTNGDLDEESAAEIAAARRERASKSQQAKQSQTQVQQQAQMNQRVQAAQVALSALGNELKAKDPDYDSKLAILQKRGFFENVAQNVPPEQWKTLFQVSYDSLGDVAKARTPVKKAAAPMRSTLESGGGSPQPKSTAEAVRLALSE